MKLNTLYAFFIFITFFSFSIQAQLSDFPSNLLLKPIEKIVSIPNEGGQLVKVKITGLQCRKKGAKKKSRKVHMMVHGFTSKAEFWIQDIIRLCEKGDEVYSFNQMGHGDSFDGIGRTEIIHGPKYLADNSYHSNYLHQMILHVQKKSPNKKIVYHGHSMGGMNYYLLAGGYVRDVGTGIDRIDPVRYKFIEDSLERSVLFAPPTNFKSDTFIMSLLMRVTTRFSLAPQMNKLLLNLGNKRKEALEGTREFTTNILDKLKGTEYERLLPVFNKLIRGLLTVDNVTIDDIKMLEKVGAGEYVQDEVMGFFQRVKVQGHNSESGIAFNELTNPNIPSLIWFGEYDNLALPHKEVVQFVKNRPSNKQIFVFVENTGHIDIAYGKMQQDVLAPITDHFIKHGVDNNLLKTLDKVSSITYVRGGLANIKNKCMESLHYIMKIGSKKRVPKRRVERIIKRATR